MSTFDAMGVQAKRKFITSSSSVSVGGMQTSLTEGETTELTLLLPKPASVKAKFSRKSFGHKIMKLFRKELETGDPAFDAQVYVATDTLAPTTALLQSSDVRATIQACVASGGAIDGSTVVAHAEGHQKSDDPGLVRLCAALLG